MIQAPEITGAHQRLPVAAMIDMVFLIVFYFLAVGALGRETHALEVQLAVPQETSTGAATALIEIDAQGILLVDSKAVDEAGLRRLVSDGSPLRVRAHDAASHASVTRALEAITRAGGEPQLEL